MLTLKRLPIDTGHENVAFLSRACTVYHAEEFQSVPKVAVSDDRTTLLATLNLVDDPDLLGPDELGLSEQAFRQLGRPAGTRVTITEAPPPPSLDSVRAKIRGRALDPGEIRAVVADVVGERYSRMELAAFLVASAGFLTTEEVLALTRAMVETGNRLEWHERLVVDKHCIGGIPGHRTSMIVVPIVAAHGLPIPKTSSRAITSPSGTADTMEVLAGVDVPMNRLRDIIDRERGCIVWGGHMNLAPADDRMIAVERPLGFDTPEQMVASILSKKLAAGSTHLLVDIPVGPTAKVRSATEAARLRKLFEYVADRTGVVLDTVVSDASEPVGNGIGPVLEVRDVLKVLRGDADAPRDLRDKALMLAGRVLDFDPGLRGGAGRERAQDLVDSGAALKALERIVRAQGPVNPDDPLHPGAAPADKVHVVRSPADGTVRALDCERLSALARLAGAPTEKGAGLDLLCKTGDRVRAGDPLYRLHAALDTDFRTAARAADAASGYTVA